MKKKIPAILIVDTGIDDAVGIILALHMRKLDIKLIVCGQGNSSLDDIVNNTLGVLEYSNAPDIQVVKGLPPKKYRFIYNAHGESGLGGFKFNEHQRVVDNTPAIDAINKVISENQGTVVIQLGLSTTLAAAFEKYPTIPKQISELVIMGGSIQEKLDTTNPYAEFNIASDPESAEIIFSSGANILMVPSELGREAYLDYYDIYKTKTTNHIGAFLEILFRSYKHRMVSNGAATCDSTAICAATNKDLFNIKPVYGFIKYFESINSGVCLYDYNKTPNMRVCTSINVKKFKKVYFKALKNLLK